MCQMIVAKRRITATRAIFEPRRRLIRLYHAYIQASSRKTCRTKCPRMNRAIAVPAAEPLLSAWCHFDVSSATGLLRLLLYIPDRSKQHGRRFPLASMSQAVLIRRARVSACLAETIQ